MNATVLRAKGWTHEEIERARAIFARAQSNRHPLVRRIEHLTFWLVLFGFGLGAIIIVLELLPLIVLASSALAITITFILASCLGLLLVHALHDLGLERSHQHAGIILLCSASILAVVLILEKISSRVVEVHTSPLLLAIALCAGILFPYLVHWRVANGSS